MFINYIKPDEKRSQAGVPLGIVYAHLGVPGGIHTGAARGDHLDQEILPLMEETSNAVFLEFKVGGEAKVATDNMN